MLYQQFFGDHGDDYTDMHEFQSGVDEKMLERDSMFGCPRNPRCISPKGEDLKMHFFAGVFPFIQGRIIANCLVRFRFVLNNIFLL